jgi:hypothetical protein
VRPPTWWTPHTYWSNHFWYPYGFGAFGLGWFYSDPWWGYGYGYPYYGYGYPGGYGYPYGYGYGYGGGGGGGYYYDNGAVRLKVKPRDAEVFVDGGYAGIVDEFDGTFQKLQLETGTHKLEIRKDGFETLSFDVHVTDDHTITLRGELKPAVVR